MCKNRTQLKCINLSRRKFDLLPKSSLPYNCSKCYLTIICPKCEKNCTTKQNSIYCSSCDRWVHLDCTSLTYDEFTFLSNTNLNYHCQKCFVALFPFNTIENNELFKLLNCWFTYFIGSTYSLRKLDSKYINAYDINKLASKCKNGFSLLNLNIRSLNKYFDKLESLIHQSKFNPDIICVVET